MIWNNPPRNHHKPSENPGITWNDHLVKSGHVTHASEMASASASTITRLLRRVGGSSISRSNILPCKQREQRRPCCAMCDQKRLARTRSAARLMEKSKLPAAAEHSKYREQIQPESGPKGYTWIVTEPVQDLIWVIGGWVANLVPVYCSLDGPERRFWAVIMCNVLSCS